MEREHCWEGTCSQPWRDCKWPRVRYPEARESASIFRIVIADSFLVAEESWCPLLQRCLHIHLIEARCVQMMEIRTATVGMRRDGNCVANLRPQESAALLSLIQVNRHLLGMPQNRDGWSMKSNADAYLDTLHRVGEDMSNDPSTGPAQRNKTVVPFEITQPCVPWVFSRPPSVATYGHLRARNNFNIWRSVDDWSIPSIIRRLDCGRLERYTVRLTKVIRGNERDDVKTCGSCRGKFFQYGTYRRKEDFI